MKTLFIGEYEAQSKESLHAYIEDALELPDYYGRNLDALYDCLTSISEQVTIIVSPKLRGMLDGYGSKVIMVIEDASLYNEYVMVKEQSDN